MVNVGQFTRIVTPKAITNFNKKSTVGVRMAKIGPIILSLRPLIRMP